MKNEKLLTQTEARQQAEALRAQGVYAIAHRVPADAWGGTERGWAVSTGECQQVWGYDEPPQHQHRCTRALRHQGAHLCDCGDGTSKGIK